ncbi:hypothetical protein BX600DRAFT_516468 [Xylariales sp. PMI_506]|nr:hypothetical protein BX600DRAFT_516468 [Xylariales sp. PMI_506]
MSRYFPHYPYAEDQPLARTILTTHVLTRSFPTGAIIGTGIVGAGSAYSKIRSARSTAAAPLSSSSSSLHSAPLLSATPALLTGTQRYLRVVGVSTLWTIGIVSIGLVGRMWGREEIEWKDRSWRLLENKGQVECDDWTYGAMAGGLVYSAARRPPGFVGLVGVLGTSSVVGMLGYMGWRYGVKGGKFD